MGLGKITVKYKFLLFLVFLTNAYFCILLRTQTVILINSENETLFYERTMDGVPDDQPMTWIESCHEFPLESE